LVHQPVCSFLTCLLGKCCEADEVGEKDSDLTALGAAVWREPRF
jgi:hypothetical protein